MDFNTQRNRQIKHNIGNSTTIIIFMNRANDWDCLEPQARNNVKLKELLK